MKLNEDPKLVAIIEQYCCDTMPLNERILFEARLLKDASLASEVQAYQQTIRLLENIALEQRVIAILKEAESSKKIIKINWLPYVGSVAAACIAFIVYVSLSLVQLPDSENDITVVRDVDTSILSLEEKKIFDHFYTGQACLTSGQFGQAVVHFKVVLQKKSLRPYFQQATEWHLVLAYLKNKQVNEAQALYNRLGETQEEVYPVGNLNKIKLWWQLFWASFDVS